MFAKEIEKAIIPLFDRFDLPDNSTFNEIKQQLPGWFAEYLLTSESLNSRADIEDLRDGIDYMLYMFFREGYGQHTSKLIATDEFAARFFDENYSEIMQYQFTIHKGAYERYKAKGWRLSYFICQATEYYLDYRMQFVLKECSDEYNEIVNTVLGVFLKDNRRLFRRQMLAGELERLETPATKPEYYPSVYRMLADTLSRNKWKPRKTFSTEEEYTAYIKSNIRPLAHSCYETVFKKDLAEWLDMPGWVDEQYRQLEPVVIDRVMDGLIPEAKTVDEFKKEMVHNILNLNVLYWLSDVATNPSGVAEIIAKIQQLIEK